MADSIFFFRHGTDGSTGDHHISIESQPMKPNEPYHTALERVLIDEQHAPYFDSMPKEGVDWKQVAEVLCRTLHDRVIGHEMSVLPEEQRLNLVERLIQSGILAFE